jgi:signal transduction histidine kinase
VQVKTPLPVVTCDAVRITEVFRNLIVNAVKYNDKPEKSVEVGFLETETDDTGKEMTNVFYVRDNGKGIAAEFYKDIFRIFKRLEKSETDTEGTGVGLTFVRKIIARHGGRIWLRSELGTGTTFFFTLATEQE